VKALLSGPKGMTLGEGGLYLADTENHAIRRVDLRSGIISTLLGTGDRGDGPDGDPLKCRFRKRRSPEICVQDDARGVDHALQ
jgi:hypothetical protein